MKKALIIIGIVVGIIVVASVILLGGVFSSSNKFVCKSDKGNITIYYNDKALTGYTAVGIEYNLDDQNKIAKEIGVKKYLEDFNQWFVTNTGGICDKVEKV